LREVVLSRRLTVLLMALVVVMALGIIGILRSVSASSTNNNADNHNDKERSTLTVLTKSREARVVDLGPKGPTHGDIRVQNAPLYNESGKEKIGRLDVFVVMTDPDDEPGEKAHMVEATYTFTLPGGEISAQGVSAYPTLSEIPPRGVNAITGGTGKYAAVQGEHRFEARGNRMIHTFHFID
jgi:hypothetical protein